MVAIELDSPTTDSNRTSSKDLELEKREKAGMGGAAVVGEICPTCQQGTVMKERDQKCLIICIILSLGLFPYGLLSFLCLRKVPTCNMCKAVF
ncbi:unnamed protein product [Caenorhabditis auriculariae]|uniref:Brain protein I3 n=1 Tax=Caenorhabditis auriculariae TaxID=2777116 RepID=A0A8S1HMT5_9PELO|nr:unnamed protein product [Caenorhabditis auriculariae]